MTVHVLGAGGHAKVVVDAIQASGMGMGSIFDDNHVGAFLDTQVSGAIDNCPPREGAVIAIGENGFRKNIAQRLDQNWQSIIHPSAVVSPSAIIEPGTVVFAGAVIQAETHIGVHAIVNTSATVDHGCVIGPFAHIGPGVNLCGTVMVGEGVLLGVGAKVVPGIKIGPWATVGAGAVVLGDVRPGETVVGNPARVVKEKTV